MDTIRLTDPKEIGDCCRAFREEKGLTQQEVAEGVGLTSRQSVSNAENATDTSRLGLQVKILNFLGKDINVIYEIS